jgi:hypothetical protein
MYIISNGTNIMLSTSVSQQSDAKAKVIHSRCHIILITN